MSHVPITLEKADEIINKALAVLVPLNPRLDSLEARVLLLAIGLQESRFEYTKQVKGPAKGYWQFEMNGGVKGVMEHPTSRLLAKKACEKLVVPFNKENIYNALEFNPVLSAVFARLLLWTNNNSLPPLGKVENAWQYYVWSWRPGKPHHHTWDKLYHQALSFVLREYIK